MNPLNPLNNPFEPKIQKEYTFEDTNSMSNFVHRISRNPGIKSVDLRSKKSINVNFMNQDAETVTDSLYNESYQYVEENEAARQAKMRKFRQDQGAAAERKKAEIERMRDAESKRKGDAAMKKAGEEEKKRKEQERKISTESWIDTKLPDVTAAFEQVKLSEMDPKKHVKKNEETGMYCVYNKDGKKVKEFKSEDDANKYATDNHDSLMEYGGKPGKPRTANEPLVKTGQGSYEKNIRPSDILKKKKKR